VSLRAFVAIQLPAPVRAALACTCGAFRDLAPTWRGDKWVATENLHVTLKFLGAIDEGRVAEATAALEAACAAHAPFKLVFDAVVAKPGGRRTTMLWATVSEGYEAAARLAGDIDTVLSEALGIAPDERAFRPHVTLVRARRPRAATPEALAAANAVLAAAGPAETRMSVTCATLVSSRLGRHTPTYEELACASLLGD
jgi:2'-5' RNA ligase